MPGLLDVPLHWSLEGIQEALPDMILGNDGTDESLWTTGFSARGWAHRWLDLRWSDEGLASAGGRLISWTPAEKGGVVDIVDDFREAPGAAAGGLDTRKITVDAGPLYPVLAWKRTLESRDDQGRTRLTHTETGAVRGRSIERQGTAGGPIPMDSRTLLTDDTLALHLWGLAGAGQLGVHVSDLLQGLEQHVPSARLAPCGKQSFGADRSIELRGWRWTGAAMLPIHGWVNENALPVIITELDRVWLLQDLLPREHALRKGGP